MDEVLGVVGLVGFIVGMVALSGAVTWAVVKLTPRRTEESK
jgi:hypothetical protein